MALPADLFDLFLELFDLLAEHAAVELDLLFPFSLGEAAAAGGLAREVGPEPFEAGKLVFDLGELDLEPGLFCLGALGEDL